MPGAIATSRFQLLTRPGCHLCAAMAELLDEVLTSHGETYRVENVDAKPEWRQRYGEQIPVLLRDGKPVAKIRVGRRQLERIVRRRRRFAPARRSPGDPRSAERGGRDSS